MRLHLLKKRWPDNRGLTACGISVDQDYWTKAILFVTCGNCKDTYHWLDNSVRHAREVRRGAR